MTMELKIKRSRILFITGFLVLYSEHAALISQALAKAGVLTDYRGSSLRLGPAPYLSDKQLAESVEILGNVCRQLKI